MKEHGLDTSDAIHKANGGKFTYQERIRKDALDRQNRIRGIAEQWQTDILDRMTHLHGTLNRTNSTLLIEWLQWMKSVRC